jgi:hypothetical protein
VDNYEDFVLGYLSGTPMAGAVAALDDKTRTAMVQHVRTSLRAYVDDDGMAAPWEAHLVTAHAQRAACHTSPQATMTDYS